MEELLRVPLGWDVELVLFDIHRWVEKKTATS
jgi:hypothetical protein